MYNKIEAQQNNTIVKANTLIQQSRFSLSTQQQKMLLYIISQINRFDNEFKMCEFKVADFCKVCGINKDNGNIYKQLKEQNKKISDKSLWIDLPNGNSTLLRWIEKPYIDEKSGVIKIKLDADMKPYLLQLKEKFTAYELIYTLNFKSKYSIRLYEYLKSIHFDELTPYRTEIKIEEFQSLLDSPYKTFRDFNSYILKTAHKEINAYSDLNFDYQLLRQGRKVESICIFISSKDIVSKLQAVNNLYDK